MCHGRFLDEVNHSCRVSAVSWECDGGAGEERSKEGRCTPEGSMERKSREDTVTSGEVHHGSQSLDVREHVRVRERDHDL